ncbi:MAG TPA: hypothetical protein VGJ15_12125 [Pirellulales bacterium]|jgi:hypothetical protein
MRIYFAPLCFAALLLFAVANIQAAVVVFNGGDPGAGSTDPRPNSIATAANFDAAVASLGTTTTVNFESSPLGSANNLTIAPGVTISGGTTEILNAPFKTPDRLFGYNTTAGGVQFLSIEGGNVTFNFSTPIEAFGFYLTGIQLGGESITFNDGSPQSIAIPKLSDDGGVMFVGFTDVGASITSVTYNGLEDIYGIDDLRFTIASDIPAVPEAGSFAIWTLLGIAGFTSMIWRGARRKALVVS